MKLRSSVAPPLGAPISGREESLLISHLTVSIAALAMVMVFAFFGGNGRAAAPNCDEGPRLNTSADKVEGTSCADVIVVPAENVDRIEGGGGDDIIFANGEVEELSGGAGDDHIYGETPSERSMERVIAKFSDEPKPVIYETAPAPPAADDPGSSKTARN